MATTLQRSGVLFDTWKGFPHFSKVDAYDERRKNKLKYRVKTGKKTKHDCVALLEKIGVMDICTMIQGDICKTVPDFAKSFNDSICLLHVDTDLYEPASVATEYFADHVVPGGIMFFHDYGYKRWPGIAKVVTRLMKKMMNILYGI